MAVVFLNYLVVYYTCLCFPKGTHIVAALSVHPSEAAFGTYGLIIMLHDKVVELKKGVGVIMGLCKLINSSVPAK